MHYKLIIKIILFFIICSSCSCHLFNEEETVNSNNHVIPLHIYSTWHNKLYPKHMLDNINKMKRDNPEFQYHILDQLENREFIRKNYDEEVLRVYDTLIPAAFKADLWRYCILYKLGGIYIDIKYRMANNSKFIDFVDREYFVLEKPMYLLSDDWPMASITFEEEFAMINDPLYYEHIAPKLQVSWNGKIGLQNCLFIVKPLNPIIGNVIRKVVDNVNHFSYGSETLSITGPTVVGNEYFKYHNDESHSNWKDFELFYSMNGYYITSKNSHLIEYYPEYRAEQSTTQQQEYYVELWQRRKIYKGYKGPPIPIAIPYTVWIPIDSFPLPPRMLENFKTLRKNNPEFSFCLQDSLSRRNFIKKTFAQDILDTYDMLKPKSMKVQFWKYIILFYFGGVTMDLKYQLVEGVFMANFTFEEQFVLSEPKHLLSPPVTPLMLQQETSLLQRGYFDYQNQIVKFLPVEKFGIDPGFMLAIPRNKFIRKLIFEVVERTQSLNYGSSVDSIVGSSMIGDVYFNADPEHMNWSKITMFKSMNGDYIFTKNGKMLEFYPGYIEEVKNFDLEEDIESLWSSKSIFGEKSIDKATGIEMPP